MMAMILSAFLSIMLPLLQEAAGPLFPEMVSVPAGSFLMGSERGGEDSDEGPVHRVRVSAFRMSATEVTNLQYEQFRPEHRALRGRYGFSSGDSEAVVQVSWEDAMAYCEWLSAQTGRLCRLPTEAEWEYACRAGAATDFWTGNTLDSAMMKHQQTERNKVPVSLAVASSAPNPFGLYDMHGNVEEWCLDWYGPYSDSCQEDPAGPAAGDFRVTRGGSHNTPVRYLRSANRSAMIPSDRHCQTGFRVVEGSLPASSQTASRQTAPDTRAMEGSLPASPQTASRQTAPDNRAMEGSLPASSQTASRQTAPDTRTQGAAPPDPRPQSLAPGVRQNAAATAGEAAHRRDRGEAIFLEPLPFVIPPADSTVHFYRHNHQPAITCCPNGDLLAIWFSCDEESGREMTVLSSRLHPGAAAWEPAVEFFKVPDRNMTGSALYTSPDGTLFHFNGVADSGDWQNLALCMRTSRDSGLSWSAPRLIAPEHCVRHQAIAGTLCTREGWLVQACDAGAGGEDGTALHISRDGGLTWEDAGGTIAGIHAGLVQLSDGSLMALGRGNSLPGADGLPRMPMSLSRDGGATWEYSPSGFPPIGSGQRLVLKRLLEGPIMLVSFGTAGMTIALSYDEGVTWPVQKLVSDGIERHLHGGAWTGDFTLDAAHAEPKGYLACTQTPDGMIHLLSSALHYRFTLSWIEL